MKTVAAEGDQLLTGETIESFCGSWGFLEGNVPFMMTLNDSRDAIGLGSGAVPPSRVAVTGDDTASEIGGQMTRFGCFPAIGPQGQIAFVTDVAGGLSDGAILLVKPDGTRRVVASLGSRTPLGGVFSGFGATTDVNGAGQMAFAAAIEGAQSPAAIFLASP